MSADPERPTRGESVGGDHPAAASGRRHVDPGIPADSTDLNAILKAAESRWEPLQFTLGEMLATMALVALILGVGSYLTEENSATRVAGLTGLGLVAYRITLMFLQPTRKLFYVVWWVLLALYLVICVFALAAL